MSTLSYERSIDISDNTSNAKSLIFSSDGTTIFILDNENIDEYVLTTGYDLTTAKYVDTLLLIQKEVLLHLGP